MSRQLDAAIAEALGDRVVYSENDCDWLAWDGDSDSDWIVPRYSADGNDMLELDREMRKRGGELDELYYDPKSTNGEWYALYGGKFDACGGRAHSEPLARALAAYKALTGKKWEVQGE